MTWTRKGQLLHTHDCRRTQDSPPSLTSGTPRQGIARLADDDPNDAADVDGGDGAQEDGALLLGCQAAQVSEEHAIYPHEVAITRWHRFHKFELHFYSNEGEIFEAQMEGSGSNSLLAFIFCTP